MNPVTTKSKLRVFLILGNYFYSCDFYGNNCLEGGMQVWNIFPEASF
jgi:hypothetical protein